jgi:hypothetical protein
LEGWVKVGSDTGQTPRRFFSNMKSAPFKFAHLVARSFIWSRPSLDTVRGATAKMQTTKLKGQCTNVIKAEPTCLSRFNHSALTSPPSFHAATPSVALSPSTFFTLCFFTPGSSLILTLEGAASLAMRSWRMESTVRLGVNGNVISDRGTLGGLGG